MSNTYHLGPVSGRYLLPWVRAIRERIDAVSLNDRFNRPGDGTLVRFDQNLTNLADHLGQYWLHHTPWERQTLTQGLLALGAFAALERVLVFHDVMYFAVAFLALQSFTRSGVLSIGRLQEEI